MSDFRNDAEWNAVSDEQLHQDITDTERLLELVNRTDSTVAIETLKTLYSERLIAFKNERERRSLHSDGHNPPDA
jgi:hypothetical protein